MSTNTFNEAEKYLLANWQQSSLVAKSMKAVLLKYVAICERVLEALQDEYSALEHCKILVKSGGCIAIGRELWQTDGNYAYFGMEFLSLDYLWDDNSGHPFVGIWTGKPKKPAMEVKAIRRILSEAETIMSEDEFARSDWGFSPDDEIKPSECEYQYQLYYQLPEARMELRSMLLDGDGQRFIDCLVAHFRVFAKFIPVLDEVFTNPAIG